MKQHARPLLVIILLTLALYFRVSGAFFCSYDDFNETHRAAFEDTRDPSRVFTTSHFRSYKYRPLNRGVNLVTYRAADGASWAFRVRNLAFHCVNVVLVYALSLLLFSSVRAATLAAAAFAVHPLTNQSVIGAVMTNTMAHGLLLGALVICVAIMQKNRIAWGALSAALAMEGAALLMYDSAVVLFAIVAAYAVCVALTKGWGALRWRWLASFAAGGLLILLIYLSLRALYVPSGWGMAAEGWPGIGVVVRNTILYAAALIAPFDSVLANQVLGTPLPSDLGRLGALLPVAAGVALLMAGAMLVAVVMGWRRAARNHDGPGMTAAFLVGAILISLAPVLVLSEHLSETYVYLPVAFYSVIVGRGLSGWVVWPPKGRTSVFAVALVLMLLGQWSAATRIRNQRVYECGRTAYAILSGLPSQRLKSGAWVVSLAEVPGPPRGRKFGFYNFRGLDTVGEGNHGDQALTSALQLWFRNDRLVGRVMVPDAFERECATCTGGGCLFARVHPDGRLSGCESTLK